MGGWVPLQAQPSAALQYFRKGLRAAESCGPHQLKKKRRSYQKGAKVLQSLFALN